ncbi:DUF2207 domain-containing protein [Caldisericum exile]|uniref:Hypothetical membrane protein n=1 Tax=Caldisericum exile (strain DSM 21853 / NBRC 104410 / AZM16c01) TaxID=511051 RepID=A0A7U6GDT4_CALEA|nr:DUF2207 domain-containing protein [Caldisericum exile]BAL80546.1 hypothetical membrane protein [Caldisericum exile AZM16c01]
MKKVLFLFLVLLLVFSLQGVVLAKDYYFPKVVVTAYIRPDGSFDFEEARTYKFDGSFHWATYMLPKEGFDRIENFSIEDESGPYKLTPNETNAPGTFTFQEQGNSYYAKFFYDATNTTKTFVFKYRVIGGIKTYKDVADFYWKLIGSGWDKKTSSFEGFVYLPSTVNEGDLKVFGHGPLNGTVERIDGQGAHYIATNVPPNTFIEARVLFPSYILPNANIIPQEKLNDIMEEELAWARQTEAEKSKVRTGLTIFFGWWALFLAIYLYLFFTFGKEPKPQKDIIYMRDIPEDLPPAIVGYLMRFENILAQDFTATILYLVKKGYIALEIKEEEKNYILFKKNVPVTYFYKTDLDPSTLGGHLSFAYDFLFNVISEGNRFVSTDTIKRFSQNRSRVAYDMFKRFQKTVQKEGRALGYFEKRTMIILIYSLALALFSIVSFLILSSYGLLFLVLFWYIFIFVFALLSLALKKRTQLGAEKYAEWNGLKKFLSDFSNLKEYAPNSIVIWENYLVYATTFGIAEKVLKYIEMNIDKIPQDEFSRSYIFGKAVTTSGTFNFASINVFTTSLNSAMQALSSTAPASTGSGGGFSGGGGGGGGGSGGGAG